MPKRSVAILGPTPSFVRWAIAYPCPLREIYPARLPETTFRQLRGIRELSLAQREGRVHAGFCIHPDADSTQPLNALGFPVDEIVELHGGMENVESCCLTCPANAAAQHQPGILAGCYGCLPEDPSFDFEKITRGIARTNPVTNEESPDRECHDLIALFEQAIAEDSMTQQVASSFLPTTPAWYGLWSQLVLSVGQLELLQVILQNVSTRMQSINKESRDAVSSHDLDCLLSAVNLSLKHGLSLQVDLVPPGFSDGQHWKIQAHCGVCKSTSGASGSPCPVCGVQGQRQNEIKLKVLGIRPYLNLQSILGESATRDLIEQYENR